MIEEQHGCLGICRARDARLGGPVDQNNRSMADARSRYFGIGRRAAAILGDDDIDLIFVDETKFRAFVERTTRREIAHAIEHKGRIDGIDASNQIEMMRGRIEGANFVASERKEDTTWIGPQRNDGIAYRWNPQPAIAFLVLPAWSADGHDRNIRSSRRRGRIRRNARGIGMRRVDKDADVFVAEKSGEAVGAAEAADARRHGLHRRIARAPCERQYRHDVGAVGKQPGKFTGFCRPAKNEDACHGVV